MNEEFNLTLSEASRLVPGRPHHSSLWRWCRKGVLARNGQRIHLEHRRFGGRIFTSTQALERFSKQLADADCEYFAPDEPSPPSPERRYDTVTKDRARRVELAERRLKEMRF